MLSNKIILNFDSFHNFSLENILSEKNKLNENSLSKIIENIATEYKQCKVNKPYAKIRKGEEAQIFQIIAKIDGEEKKVFGGQWKDYHESLIMEVSAKFFYNFSLDFPISPDAFDFIRRISQKDWTKIAELINEAPSLAPEQIIAFKEQQWEHPVFKEKEWPALALKAYFQNEIDRDKISTLFLYDTFILNQCKEGQINQFFNKVGELNEEAFRDFAKFSMEMLDVPIPSTLELLLADKKAQAILFKIRNLVETLPAGENHYFIFTQKFEDTLSEKLFVPTPYLLKELLKLKFGTCAIRPRPVLGELSMRDDFTHKGYRDIYIPCRYILPPIEIHEISTKNQPFFPYFHDLVHCLLESNNPHRTFWLELAATVELHKTPTRTNAFILETLLDRAFAYDQENPEKMGILDVFSTLIDIMTCDDTAMKLITVYILEKSDHRREFIQALLDKASSADGEIILKYLEELNLTKQNLITEIDNYYTPLNPT